MHLKLNRMLSAKQADVALQPEDIIFVPGSFGKRPPSAVRRAPSRSPRPWLSITRSSTAGVSERSSRTSCKTSARWRSMIAAGERHGRSRALQCWRQRWPRPVSCSPRTGPRWPLPPIVFMWERTASPESAPDTAVFQFNISVQESKARRLTSAASEAAEQVRQLLKSNQIDPPARNRLFRAATGLRLSRSQAQAGGLSREHQRFGSSSRILPRSGRWSVSCRIWT